MPPGTRRFSKSRSVFCDENDDSFWVPPAPATHLCNAGWAHRLAWPMVLASAGSSQAPPYLALGKAAGEQGVGAGLFLQDDGALGATDTASAPFTRRGMERVTAAVSASHTRAGGVRVCVSFRDRAVRVGASAGALSVDNACTWSTRPQGSGVPTHKSRFRFASNCERKA